MNEPVIAEIKELIDQIEEDISVPKNIKLLIRKAYLLLEDNNYAISIRIDKSLQCLDELEDESNIPIHTRTQIWDIVSRLESI